MDMMAGFAQVWHAESPWVVAWALLCTLLLVRRGGEARAGVLNTAVVFAVATAAQLAAAALFAANMLSGAVALFNVALLVAGVAAQTREEMGLARTTRASDEAHACSLRGTHHLHHHIEVRRRIGVDGRHVQPLA